jgi:hypothetical protein
MPLRCSASYEIALHPVSPRASLLLSGQHHGAANVCGPRMKKKPTRSFIPETRRFASPSSTSRFARTYLSARRVQILGRLRCIAVIVIEHASKSFLAPHLSFRRADALSVGRLSFVAALRTLRASGKQDGNSNYNRCGFHGKKICAELQR